MKKAVKVIGLLIICLTVSACSVFGRSGVEIAPYTVLKKDGDFELRYYPELILVSTPMQGMQDQRSPFGKLFDYISGENQKSQKISMTAPVFLDQIDSQAETMSFVMPKDFSLASTPLPSDPSVKLELITDYTVATVTFNGRLKQNRIDGYKQQLQVWIEKNNLTTTGAAKAAGYNPPFTLSPFRRNEVLIPVQKP